MICRTLSLSLVLGLVAPVTGQTAKLKDALPNDTLLYLAAPDLRSSLEEMREMPLLRMWREAEVQDFFADALKMAGAMWDEQLKKGREAHEMGMMPFSPDELLKLRVDGFGFAVTKLDLTKGEFEPQPKIGLVLQMDFGESAAVWRSMIQFGLQMAEQQGQGKFTKKVSKVGDVEITTFVPPETEMSLNIAFVGDTMLFGTLESDFKAIIERLGSGKAALSASANFQKTFAELDAKGAELEAYIQPGPFLDFVMKALTLASEEEADFPAELDVAGIGRALEALGLHSIHGIGSTTSYAAGEDIARSVSKGYVLAPAPTRRGLLASAQKDIDLSFLKWVPKDAASFSASSFDLVSVYAALTDALKAYDEEKATQIMGMLALYEQQFGISVKEDLIGSFGHEFINWSMPVATITGAPEMAILIQVKDQERLLKTLGKAAELSDGLLELDKSERRGITVYQLLVNYDPMGGMGINPFDMFIPTFSFKEGYLVAGFSTGDVKRVFKRMEREDDPSGDIRSNVEFKPYLGKLPQGGMSSVSFVDWKANFEGLYQLVTSLIAFVPVNDDIPIDLSLLPDVQTLTQHLYGSVSWSTTDGNGYHTMGIGPWGPETVGLLGAAVVAGAGFAIGTKQGFFQNR